MFPTTQQRKATAERRRRRGIKKRLQGQKGSSEKTVTLQTRFWFLQRPPTRKFHKPGLVSLRRQEREAAGGVGVGARLGTAPPTPPPADPRRRRPPPHTHTRESTEKTKDENGYGSSGYTAYSQHTERSRHEDTKHREHVKHSQQGGGAEPRPPPPVRLRPRSDPTGKGRRLITVLPKHQTCFFWQQRKKKRRQTDGQKTLYSSKTSLCRYWIDCLID